jgi:hypothetical protein
VGKISHMASSHYNSPTSFNAGNTLLWDTYVTNGYPITLLLQDDGTNKKFAFSPDGGLYIIPTFSESHTSFVTPTQVGFFYDSNSSNYAGGIELLSWYIATNTTLF